MISQEQKEMLRSLPAVHEIMEEEQLLKITKVDRNKLTEIVQDTLSELRKTILTSELSELNQKNISPITTSMIIEQVKERIQLLTKPRLRRVINGTGVVLHTNLGRAPLSTSATEAVQSVAASYSNLEYDIETGKRGSRHSHVEDLICRITGAEAAMVVNNNAAAVYLVLRELAKGREVIVSRGQLVEIGGSFRVSEIMRESGAQLVEVGTTNKTHLYDYERAITEQTALMMRVHTSNFKIIGFSAEVELTDLVQLGKENRILVYEDLGSGVLYDLKKHRIGEEPTVQEVVAAGADVITFSGDKLLGGPQAGIIVGSKEIIQRLKKNQLARVLRVDKMTLSGLEATLRHYLHPEKAVEEIPTLEMIFRSKKTIEALATDLKSKLQNFPSLGDISVIEGTSEVGGGSLPGLELPTYLVAIQPKALSVSQLEKELRLGEPTIVVRVQKDQILMDARTLLDGEIDWIAQRLEEISKGES